jgi:hypothetical protein
MAAEKPNIKSVLNDIIEVALPNIEGNPTTYLTEEVAATGTSQTFADNSGFTNGDYIMLDEIGGETTEIVKINGAITYGTAVTTTACTFAHGRNTKVTLIRYNQVAIYGSTSASDAAPIIIGVAVNLDVAHGFNVMKASTTYDYYYAKYYNVGATTYSTLSDSVASTGLPSYARGELKKEFLSIYNEQIDDLITDDWLNRAINRWQREISKRRKYWSILKAVQITDLQEDTQGYDLPTDIQDGSRDSIISVKIYNDIELTNIDAKVFINLTYDHVGTLVDTAAAVGGTSLVLDDSSDFTQQNGTVYCKGVKIGYTLNTESTGTLSGITTCVAITAFADAGSGYTTVTAAGHGLHNGDTAYIGSTRNYDGSYPVSGVAGNDFNILKTFVADDATGAVSEYDDVITETLSVGDEVWQTRTTGQPTRYLIDTETYKTKLYPIPDSTFDGRNLVIEYWKKFEDLVTDADEVIFNQPDNLFLYLNYQLGIRRRLAADEVLTRKAEWKDDLENIVVADPDYKEIRIQVRNLYTNPY